MVAIGERWRRFDVIVAGEQSQLMESIGVGKNSGEPIAETHTNLFDYKNSRFPELGMNRYLPPADHRLEMTLIMKLLAGSIKDSDIQETNSGRAVVYSPLKDQTLEYSHFPETSRPFSLVVFEGKNAGLILRGDTHCPVRVVDSAPLTLRATIDEKSFQRDVLLEAVTRRVEAIDTAIVKRRSNMKRIDPRIIPTIEQATEMPDWYPSTPFAVTLSVLLERNGFITLKSAVTLESNMQKYAEGKRSFGT